MQAEESRTPSAGGKKSRASRKHVIIGVTCALVVAMVITGVLVGVKFYLDGANELVTVSTWPFPLFYYNIHTYWKFCRWVIIVRHFPVQFFRLHATSVAVDTISSQQKHLIIEVCIDDERQFKTAKRQQAPGDATVRKRFFRDNFVIFRLIAKRIIFFESMNFYTCVICKFSWSSRDHFAAPFRGLYLVIDSLD